MEERKTIDRAKGIIMQTYSLSESEAYEWLRSNSMKHRVPMLKLASEILGSSEMVKTR
jgi:response regulator NasT